MAKRPMKAHSVKPKWAKCCKHDNLEWVATMDGGGYWQCTTPDCEYVDGEGTGHHGG